LRYLKRDALNLLTRRLRSQGLPGMLRRYLNKARYRRLGLPVYLMIEPASTCNLRCPYCSALQTSEAVPSGIMKLEQFQGLLDDILARKNYCPPLDLFYRGEPLINPDFAAMVRSAAERSLTVGTSTNATLLNERRRGEILTSGLATMIVSFDGATKQTYEAHRVGAVFEKVVENVSAFTAERRRRRLKRPFVDLQFIVTRKNHHEIDLMRELCRQMGVDHLSLKSMRVPLMDRPLEEALALGRDLLPDDPAFRRYREVRDEEGRVCGYECLTAMQTCEWGRSAAIRANGDIGLCCQDYGDTVRIGNVFEANFWELWWSETYRKIRESIGQRRLPICRTCD